MLGSATKRGKGLLRMDRQLRTTIALAGYRRSLPGTQPEYLHSPYVSSRKRAPSKSLIAIPATLTEVTGPRFSSEDVATRESDLTRQRGGAPLGERIIVSGRVVDEDRR